MSVQNVVNLTGANRVAYRLLVCRLNFADFHKLTFLGPGLKRGKYRSFFLKAHITVITAIMIPGDCFQSMISIFRHQLAHIGCFKKADDHYTMQDEDLTVPRRIEFCTGSFMAVRTDVFKEIGGFDPGYFMYVEDADLTQKVLQKGTVWLAPQFSAIHAWHRAPMRDAGKFKMQLVSMGRYFKKWGCGKGTV